MPIVRICWGPWLPALKRSPIYQVVKLEQHRRHCVARKLGSFNRTKLDPNPLLQFLSGNNPALI